MNEDKVMEIIMNLKKFNNDLMDLNIKYAEEIERLNNIINKAIEYIRKLEFESEELYDISEVARLELLNILQGSDKE